MSTCSGRWSAGCKNGTRPHEPRASAADSRMPDIPAAMTSTNTIPRTLWVSPKPEFKAAMIFIERQIDSLLAAGVEGRTFHLESRTSPGVLLREWRRLRAEIREFRPDIVHAQYGTVTAFLCVLATCLPIVVTFRGSDLNPDPAKGHCAAGSAASCRRWRPGACESYASAGNWSNACGGGKSRSDNRALRHR